MGRGPNGWLLWGLLITGLFALPGLGAEKPEPASAHTPIGAGAKPHESLGLSVVGTSRKHKTTKVARLVHHCEAQDRCDILAKIANSRNAAELDGYYAKACHAYPERALRALRLYQLAPSPSREIALLDTMPRGIADFASLLWVTTDGGSENLGDISYLYGTFCPDDELPSDGCTHWSISSTRRAFNEYYEAVARGVARHPRYMPRFFAVCEFFGHREDPKDYAYSKNERLRDFFSGLLAPLYKDNPKDFRIYAKRTRYGDSVLRQARSQVPPSQY